MFRLPFLLLIVAGLGACRWQPSQQIEIQVSRSDPHRGNPADPLDLQCFFATVQGDDIKPTLASTLGNVDAACLDTGALSGLVDKDELQSSGIKMTVTAGSNRTVRLLGIQGITQSCDQVDLATLIAGTTTLQIYQLGETTTDLFKDSEVTIENGYKPASATELISKCTSTTPTPTGGISGLGKLEKIYVGSTSFSFNPSDIDGTLPPTNSAGQFGPMVSLPIDSDAVGANAKVLGFNPLPAGGVNGFIRVDLIFSATVTPGWNFRVEVAGFAGSSFFNATTCGSGFDSFGMLAMALWDQGTATDWDTVLTGNTITVVGPESFKITESGDLPTGQYFHVSLRSSAVSDWNSILGSGTCSALQLINIFTDEYNPALMSSNNNYDR